MLRRALPLAVTLAFGLTVVACDKKDEKKTEDKKADDKKADEKADAKAEEKADGGW